MRSRLCILLLYVLAAVLILTACGGASDSYAQTDGHISGENGSAEVTQVPADNDNQAGLDEIAQLNEHTSHEPPDNEVIVFESSVHIHEDMAPFTFLRTTSGINEIVPSPEPGGGYFFPEFDVSISIYDENGALIQEIPGLLQSTSPYNSIHDDFMQIAFDDLNFDGYLDMRLFSYLHSERHPMWGRHYHWLWDEESGQYIFNEQLTEFLTSAHITVDEETRTWRYGWVEDAGNIIILHHYGYENGVFVLIRREEINYRQQREYAYEKFIEVLQGDAGYYDVRRIYESDDVEVSFEYVFLNLDGYFDSYSGYNFEYTQFTFINVEGSAIPAVVLEISPPFPGDRRVLYYDNGVVRGDFFSFRGMRCIRTDGTFCSSSGAAYTSMARLQLSSGVLIAEVFAQSDTAITQPDSIYWDTLVFIIDGEEVTYERWSDFNDEFDQKEEMPWYAFSADTIAADFSAAWDNHFGGR